MTDHLLHQDDANHVRLKQILAELEQALQNIPPESPQAITLQQDFLVLKGHLEQPEVHSSVLHEQIDKTRDSASDLLQSVEGAILKESPYLAEIGRILGMI